MQRVKISGLRAKKSKDKELPSEEPLGLLSIMYLTLEEWEKRKYKPKKNNDVLKRPILTKKYGRSSSI